MKSENKLGLIGKNNFGTEMKIIKVISWDKVLIEFQDWKKFKKEIYWMNFKKGTVKNPYDKIRYGVGYMGAGEYKVESILGIHDKSYDAWQNMLERCYSEKLRYKHPAYENCTVCEEWHNYQNFAKWYKKNEYETDGRLHLDKDIIKPNNTIYSPEFCLLVPQRINMIFMQKSRKVDPDLPNGINRCVSGFSTYYNTTNLGVFPTLEEALIHYNKAKTEHVHNVAKEYKGKIPKRLYNILKNYKL